jgi:hypothetical protein
MAKTIEDLKAKVRETPLKERLAMCKTMIGNMCSKVRPPKMTIPVHWEDEDIFINTTLEDAEKAL